ncbi:MAG: hypothetical protein ABIR68_14925 [Ilumatobacteraceae bacterium]
MSTISDPHEHEDAGTADHAGGHDEQETGREPGTMRRRGLVAAALAGAAAIAVGRPDRAAAASGDVVVLGGDNTAGDQTLVRNTAQFPLSGNRALFVSCEVMTAGRGIEAVGSHAGVSAIGNSSKAQFPSGRAVGLETTTLDSDGYGALISAGSGLAPLRLAPMDVDGSPTTGGHNSGEMMFDRHGRMFICTAAGFPGTWVEVGAATIPPAAVTTLTMLATPERFIDTRTGLGGVRGPVAGGTTSSFTMTGRGGQSGDPALQIPDNATALAGNLIVTGAARVATGSFVTVWPAGRQPPTPTLFFTTASLTGPTANGLLAGLAGIGIHRGLQVFNSAACDYSLDVTGYSAPG